MLWHGLNFNSPIAPFLQRDASKKMGDDSLKQRFLNQKLGKRTSRTSNLRKAKLVAVPARRSSEPALPGRNAPKGKPL